MLLRSTTKPPILVVLTKNHISEAFRIDFVNTSMLLRSKTKPPFLVFGGGLTKHRFFFNKGGNRASVYIDSKKRNPPKGCVFLLGGVIIKGGDYITYVVGGLYIYIYRERERWIVVYICIYIYVYISLSLSIYIYIYMHNYIYIYIYTCRPPDQERPC